MQYHELDNLQPVSQVCFGGASISGEGGGYGFGAISQKDAIDLLYYALDCGINFFDTAPIYGFMESEKRIAAAFKKNREQVVIASKCGVDWHENKRVNMSNDPDICQKMLDNSLRLHSYLDLYMIHWPDEKVDIRYTLEVLQNAKEKGHIKAIGLCNTTNDELKLAKEVCKISVVQNEVNLFNNQNEGLNFEGFSMGWGTFDKGILTGSVNLKRNFDKDDCRSWAPWWKKSNWKEKVTKVNRLKEFAENNSHSLLEMALGYSLNVANIQSAICGFKTIKQLDQILEVVKHLPPKETILAGKELLE